MMNAQLETNKQLVREFYNLAFNQQQPEEAARRYVGPSYRQHNPQAGDGAEAFIQFVTGFLAHVPQLSVDIKRTIAEGDFVVTHCLLKMSPEDRGTAVMDIFRLEDGKIVEHWDVLQPVPETAANDNTMF
ncbi:MAG: nuclear transport factor 2 family protein [Chloroflexota bacterium]|jgi:predicted SnoaL-like aldol condensation-catalyzing enzyme|nr:nuclear transport factor 2 family protein [Chloroflexota bacterium]MDQ5853036.1 nuclear transport factor 2 family protein [Chloroflexota bacterium]